MKYVLWIIDSFSKFMVGKLIANKKADTVMQATMDSWCMNVGFPTIGFYADNGGEFFQLSTYLKKKGVRHERSLPRRPATNARAERWHDTIENVVRCALLGAAVHELARGAARGA